MAILFCCPLPTHPAHFLDQQVDQPLTFDDLPKDPPDAGAAPILPGLLSIRFWSIRHELWAIPQLLAMLT